MSEIQTTRSPQPGEALILVDGRHFVFAAVQDGARGWWFTATAQDGRCTLHGNMRLTWDAEAGVWRPEGVKPPATSPPSMRRTPQARLKHVD